MQTHCFPIKLHKFLYLLLLYCLSYFLDGESALDKITQDNFDKRSLKPHEKRALNFLINEYLLLQNYKLTSITFSDENPDQVNY